MTEQIACRRVREGLTEYLEDALPPARRQGFETHLAACARCRRLLGAMRCALEAAAALPREPMPPGMKERILRAFRDP